jgi:hypothetical protein
MFAFIHHQNQQLQQYGIEKENCVVCDDRASGHHYGVKFKNLFYF